MTKLEHQCFSSHHLYSKDFQAPWPIIFIFDVFLHVDATKCYISSSLTQSRFARSQHFVEGRLEVWSTTRVKRNFSARGLYFREWLQCSGCQGKTFLVAHGQWPHSLYPCNTQTQTHRHTNTGAQIQTMSSFPMYTSCNKETHNTTTKTQTIAIFLNLVKLTRRMWIKLKGNNHT